MAGDRPGGATGHAILLMCGAVACFAVNDATVKWLSRSIDPLMVAWGRYFFNVLLVSAVLNPIRRPGLLRSNRPGLQVLRSALLLGCTVLNFLALQYLQLTQTIAIQFAMPLIVALLAGPMLGEWAGPQRLAAVAVGFCGVLVIARPGSGTLHPAVLLTMGNTILYAFYAILTRKLAAHDRSDVTTYFSGLVGAAIMTPLVPFVWTTPPSGLVWAGLVFIGIASATGHWLLILAHARAPAPILSPFIYTQIAWMILLGYAMFGDVPDAATLTGAAIVVASGLYLLSWERMERRRQA